MVNERLENELKDSIARYCMKLHMQPDFKSCKESCPLYLDTCSLNIVWRGIDIAQMGREIDG